MSGSPRVLVVEDEFLPAWELSEVLAEHGFAVVGPVRSVGDAVRMATEQTLDAAVLDVRVVGGDSTPVARVLAARGCPFLFTTGYAPSEVPTMPGWDAPALTKPVDHAALVRTLRRLLGA